MMITTDCVCYSGVLNHYRVYFPPRDHVTFAT